MKKVIGIVLAVIINATFLPTPALMSDLDSTTTPVQMELNKKILGNPYQEDQDNINNENQDNNYDKHTGTVNENDKNYIMTKEKNKDFLPQTGIISQKNLVLFGVILLLSCIIGVLFIRKTKKI